MLYIGQPNHVTFKVTVAGSSSEPEARVFVGSNPALCFGAVRDDAGVFHADVMLPPTATTGDTDFRVEVLLNNRVFVPIKKSVPVIFVDAAMVSSIEEMPPVEEMPEVPSIEEMSPAEVVPEVPPVEDVVTTTQVSVKTTTAPMSILRSFEQAAEEERTEISAPPKRTLDASIFAFPTKQKPAVQPEKIVLQPVSINLENLKSIKSPKQRTRKASPLECAEGSNITITKGKVVLI